MSLRGEVHDQFRLLDKRTAELRVCDVAVNEDVSRVVHDVVQVLAAAGIRELVEGRDPPVGVSREREPHEVTADESGPTRHEDLNHPCVSSRRGAYRVARDGTHPARRIDRVRSVR